MDDSCTGTFCRMILELFTNEKNVPRPFRGQNEQMSINTITNQREITRQSCGSSVWHRLIVLYNCMKFHSYSCNGFRLTEQTRNSIVNDHMEITPKYAKHSYSSCTWHIVSLCSTIVWSFIQIARTVLSLQNGHKIAFTNVPRGIIWKYTSKSCSSSCTRHVVSMCFTNVWSYIKISLWLSSYRADTIFWQTD